MELHTPVPVRTEAEYNVTPPDVLIFLQAPTTDIALASSAVPTSHYVKSYRRMPILVILALRILQPLRSQHRSLLDLFPAQYEKLLEHLLASACGTYTIFFRRRLPGYPTGSKISSDTFDAFERHLVNLWDWIQAPATGSVLDYKDVDNPSHPRLYDPMLLRLTATKKYGYTNITLLPTNPSLKTIHLHSRQCKLKRKIYSALAEGDEGELSIAIPKEVSLRQTDHANHSLLNGHFNEASSSCYLPTLTHIVYRMHIHHHRLLVLRDVGFHASTVWETCTWEFEFVVPRYLEEPDPGHRGEKGDFEESQVSISTVVICSGDLVEQACHPRISLRAG
ncbi:hypothetical protein EDD22DRAFT_854719 [Suillus occidentalis]|nr:hypothetical protein EDD22DRAFT_854719 [Suillus occidentalis]